MMIRLLLSALLASMAAQVYGQCPNITFNQNGGTFGTNIIQFQLSGTYWSNGCGGNDITVTYNAPATTGSCVQEKFQQASGAANCSATTGGGGKEKLEYTGCDASYCRSGSLSFISLTITQKVGTTVIRQETCTYDLQSYSSVTGQCSYVLPVEMVYFKAVSLAQSGVKLLWQTASESNNAFFIVQRSYDGRVFRDIDTLAGAGNSEALIDYEYIDQPEWTGSHVYYRIKQQDFDGQFAMSRVEAVGVDAAVQLFCYPNPNTQGTLYVKFYSPLSYGKAKATLYNLLGEEMYVEEVSIWEGMHQLEVQHRLPKGIYLLQLEMNGAKVAQSRVLVD
jgi:hypothetical protein